MTGFNWNSSIYMYLNAPRYSFFFNFPDSHSFCPEQSELFISPSSHLCNRSLTHFTGNKTQNKGTQFSKTYNRKSVTFPLSKEVRQVLHCLNFLSNWMNEPLNPPLSFATSFKTNNLRPPSARAVYTSALGFLSWFQNQQPAYFEKVRYKICRNDRGLFHAQLLIISMYTTIPYTYEPTSQQR